MSPWTAALRLAFGAADRFAPRAAASLAGALWFTPPRPRPARSAPPGEAFTVDLDGTALRGTAWGGPGPRVYFQHGWGGRGADVAALVPALLERGFRVVTVDGPVHGDTAVAGPGRTNAAESGRALAAVVARHGPAHAVVAHSLGAVAATLALRSGALACDRLVLLAPVVEARTQLAAFCGHLGVGRRTAARLDAEVLRRTGLPLDDFTLAGAQDRLSDVLVVHDRDDRLAPYGATAAHVRGWPAARLVTTEGLGHHRVLRDPVVATAVAVHLATRAGVPAPRVPARR